MEMLRLRSQGYWDDNERMYNEGFNGIKRVPKLKPWREEKKRRPIRAKCFVARVCDEQENGWPKEGNSANTIHGRGDWFNV